MTNNKVVNGELEEEKFEEYVKRPIAVEAYQTEIELDIETLEGVMHADVGDYIVKGIHGEPYPVKPDIFHETYDSAESLKVCACEEEPRMGFFIDPEAPILFQELHSIIHDNTTGTLFLAFEMGSLQLDISNPANWLEINRTYIKAINADNNELSIIRVDKVAGLIYEPEVDVELEDLEE